jgi:Domain of unknown function (DUF5916)/Carbohydrate family 9 binding domain-like
MDRNTFVRAASLMAWMIFCFSTSLWSQSADVQRQLSISKTIADIKIDGILDDSVWVTAAQAKDFINKWPTDTGAAVLQTEVLITYNDQYLYLGIKAYHTDKELVIQSLKRDVNPYYSDGVSIVLDPSNRNLSGYTFGVNAAGAQFEGIAEVNNASFEWDAKWFSGVQRFKDYWTAELAIPFNSLRFPSGQTHWSMNFIRNDMTNNCFSTWNRVPLQFFGANLNYLARLSFADSPPQSKHNYALFPYITTGLHQDRAENGGGTSSDFNGGIDAKVALTASMNMDLTINPDFSQVDVDRQIINLNRFSILLPERRTFFLENSDLFSNRGLVNEATPFVSRKIGLTDDGRAVPIIAGARVSGSINPGLRIGIMNVQGGRKYGLPSQNYTVGSFDQRILKRSNIRGMVTSRNAQLNFPEHQSFQKYNTVGGMEFNFLSDDSRFNGRTSYYHSFNPGNPSKAGFGLAALGFTNQNWSVTTGWTQLNTNFISDLGFTPRLYNYDATRDTTVRIGYTQYNAGVNYSFYPKSKKTVNMVVYGLTGNRYYTEQNRPIELNGEASVTVLFADRREAAISWVQTDLSLLYATTIFSETGTLNEGGYNYGFLRLRYASNFLKPFSWGTTIEQGRYFNGDRTTVIGNIKYRRQPWGNFGVDFTYNQITLNQKKINPFIVGPTVELFFSRLISLTTFMQYNTAVENFNINSRFQWRFRPMSDIFLVYSDNYVTEGFANKNRTLVLKVSLRIN